MMMEDRWDGIGGEATNTRKGRKKHPWPHRRGDKKEILKKEKREGEKHESAIEIPGKWLSWGSALLTVGIYGHAV